MCCTYSPITTLLILLLIYIIIRQVVFTSPITCSYYYSFLPVYREAKEKKKKDLIWGFDIRGRNLYTNSSFVFRNQIVVFDVSYTHTPESQRSLQLQEDTLLDHSRVHSPR